MTEQFVWDDRFEEILVFGAEDFTSNSASNDQCVEFDSNKRNKLFEMKSQIQDLLFQFRKGMEGLNDIQSEIISKDEALVEALKVATESGLSDKIEDHITKQLTLKLLKLSRAMRLLENYQSVDKIPEYILSIKDNLPPAILPNMKIYSQIQSTVKSTKTSLLNKFLEAFERHLDEESYGSGVADGMELKSWAVFLKQARSWLLAYTLVSVLPSILMSSRQAVLESFKMTIDEALTPLWGRFFHHLKQGRDTKSTQQVFWTFSFAKNYITMLFNLCSFITSADKLVQLCDVDYAKAGKEQVMEKSVKFLRAHVAQIMVEHDFLSSDSLARLVEDCLDLDSWLRANGATVTISTVLYEASPLFHRILWLEQSFVFQQIHSHCDNFDDAFTNILEHDREGYENSASELCCYKSVYCCISLIHQCRKRYSFFPYAGQQIFSEVILEPILCLGVGLLLYKVRSSPVLYSVASGNKNNIGDDHLCRSEVQAFAKAVSYFTSAMESLLENEQEVAASSSRCKRRWNIVQSWMPNILITPRQWKLGFGLKDLLRTTLKTSDKFKSSAYEYRIKGMVTLTEGETLTDCMKFVRALATALVDLLHDYSK